MIKDINKIREHLIGCIEVEIPYPFKQGELVKYITMKDEGESFYTGGEFVNIGNNTLILKNNFSTWSVPTFIFEKKGDISYKSRFFIMEKKLEDCNKDNKQLKETIDFQQNIIDKLGERVKEVEEENELLKNYIQSR